MSFKSYLKKNLKNIIVKNLSIYLGISDLKFDTKIGAILIEDMEELNFNCYVIVYINYSNTNKNKNFNKKDNCYMVVCSGNLKTLENTFKVITIDKFRNIKLSYRLDENFIPILDKEQLDIVANNFLKKYYPTALSGQYINVEKLLNNLGLKLKYKKLSLDKAIFGLICFNDIKVLYYENNIEHKELASKGTIYIDTEATCDYAGNYTANFAIVHECVHWYLHRKYFAFGEKILKCFNNNQTSNYSSKEDLNWMEYQANEIASRIILPGEITKRRFEKLLNILKKSNNESDAILKEKCISIIAENAKISKETVKVRLLKLGLNVNGLAEYVDGKYIQPYLYKRTLNPGESYSISIKDFLFLTMTDENLRKLISTDKYIFIDNHLCFKNSKYVYIENNRFYLTKYALNNIDECCVLFKYTVDKKFEYVNKYDLILCKTQTKKQKLKIKDFESIEEIKVNPEKFGEYYNKISVICDDLPYGFRKKIRYLRECIGMTREKLEEKSYISAQTIKEIETNTKRGYSIETLIALCIGMKLPPEFSFDLLRIGGFNIENNISEKNCLYCFILRNLYNSEIDEVNEFLEKNNVEAISKEK